MPESITANATLYQPIVFDNPPPYQTALSYKDRAQGYDKNPLPYEATHQSK
jgi:hypothetical protein